MSASDDNNTVPPSFDPFAPQDAGLKTRFVRLKLFATPVVLEKGASYRLKEVHDRDGNQRDWNGKRIDKTSKRFHIVLHARAEDKDGNEYEMSRDYLNSDKPYKMIVHPGLSKVFGDTANWPISSYAFVKLEEVPTGESFVSQQGQSAGQTLEKTAWRVVEKYKNEAALKSAEHEFFARFTGGAADNSSNGASGPTFNDDLIKVFKKNSKKGAKFIAENFVDDSVIEEYGIEAVMEAVEAILAG